MKQAEFDVGIIGGGPAGSAMASYLAQAGLSCVLFERALFPRPHVGESLVPSSTRVLKDLGLLEKMDQARFVRKYGAAWTAADRGPIYNMQWEGLEADCYAGVRFDERSQPGVDRNYTFHVDRGKFDLLLLQHANEKGATIYEGIQAQSVEFADDDYPSIHFMIARQMSKVKVRMVVDASGRRTLLGNQLKLRVQDPVFDQYALHTWFEGYDRRILTRNEAQQDFIFIHFLPLINSWVWQIPITETVTSIGVVTQKRNFARSRQEREAFFWHCLESRPELAAGLRDACQVRPLREEGDYSYAMKQICGDHFLLLGDAARFVDPVFSTGVSIALNSARFASAAILRAAEQGDFRKQSFEAFETTLRRGTRNWYEFISVYYRLNVLFTAFVQNERYRLEVLKLLQGDVYDEEEPEVLRMMKDIVSEVERNEKHIWHRHLGSLTASAFRPLF
ncbi:NAD(P)/FAD-dependent oxidoreductase [Ktedonosporobacter rubrisoli]|uniref:NAD(P)/FAD-dependent oxidoreductase n=1 Tax=Ktedonosporobacter rubrisoli TaxID=2509675 RepID=A0A4V0YYS1_KTERU|nr:NAD(P)/FAD-dependent oxidoreductase [Ktedonosporobacter rubrisoli]QBD77201.1 NAD(P)/FAD-dependent oxidoreductase [Ktedonosporobacter rubrisoli]